MKNKFLNFPLLLMGILFAVSLSVIAGCSKSSDDLVNSQGDGSGSEEEEYVPDYANMGQTTFDLLQKTRLNAYFTTDYECEITNVSVTANNVIVDGICSGTDDYYLCEITPYDSLLMTARYQRKTIIAEASFTKTFARFVSRDGYTYDRAISKWVIAQTGTSSDKLMSHARYADDIEATETPSEVILNGRKGIGGFDINRGFTTDLDELTVTSVTVNIPFVEFMSNTSFAGAIEHIYGGKTYYFNESRVNSLDQTILTAYQRNIAVAAILLVQTSTSGVGEILTHPAYTTSGIFTMPNMTTAEGLNCYAAALDFLASRYCRSDNQYGRIHYWIMHNEVDCGVEWTNMGEDRTMEAYMDAYVKSMRLCYNISRQYDAKSQVLASFTHSWKEPCASNYFASKDMIDELLDYSESEGDFQWGLACHPYPQNLFDPKAWNDTYATFSMNTKFVTFKNLEVLDAWAKKSENEYLGTIKRTVFLSENGTNSPSYSTGDLKNQAAGLAYAWKKLEVLDGIDAMQWHNWIDNRAEGGLRIGLRRFPDDTSDPGGKKPVWYVYQAAGTDNEDNIFDQYKATIGISDWDEVRYTGTIQ